MVSADLLASRACENRKLIYAPTYLLPTHLRKQPFYAPTHLPIYVPPYLLPTHLHTYRPTHLPTTHVPAYLPTYLPTHAPTHLRTYPLTSPLTHLRTYAPTHLRTYAFTYLRAVSSSRGLGGARMGLNLASVGFGWLDMAIPRAPKSLIFI